jgi:hypothetical protein
VKQILAIYILLSCNTDHHNLLIFPFPIWMWDFHFSAHKHGPYKIEIPLCNSKLIVFSSDILFMLWLYCSYTFILWLSCAYCCFFNFRSTMVNKHSELAKRHTWDRYGRFASPSSRTAPPPSHHEVRNSSHHCTALPPSLMQEVRSSSRRRTIPHPSCQEEASSDDSVEIWVVAPPPPPLHL